MSQPDEPSEVKPTWEYTMLARRHANESPYGSAGGGPYGSYRGRHIIGRNSRILGGISMVAGHPILIVVSEEDTHLPVVYSELTARLADRNVRTIPGLLAEVHALVRERLTYVRDLNKQIRREKSRGGQEVKLPLAYYVSIRKGVCWQQGLLAAYLIEKLIDDGVVGGSVSTDRNKKRDVLREWADFSTDEWVGHQWARYTAPDGTAYIVDPAQDYCGRLVDVDRKKRGHWRDYFRPEDPIPAPPPKPPSFFDELDFLVAAGIVAAVAWKLVT